MYCISMLLLALDHWPSGTYGLPKPENGCPSPAEQWSSGGEIILCFISLLKLSDIGENRHWN